ncbi:MAG: hypothetical protein U0570_09385 [Phycisphaerales bacterium]
MSLFSTEKKSHGTGGSFLTFEMYNEVGGAFKTFEALLASFCQKMWSIRLHVPEIASCSVVYTVYSDNAGTFLGHIADLPSIQSAFARACSRLRTAIYHPSQSKSPLWRGCRSGRSGPEINSGA